MSQPSPRVAWAFLALALTVLAGCDQIWRARLDGAPLDPNRYRAEIVAIDGVLFQAGPLKWRDRQILEQQMLTLADAADDDPNNPIALEESLDLRLLSTMAASGQVSSPVVNSELTRQWRRIRGSLFTNAAWFRQTTSVASAPPLRPSGPSSVTSSSRSALKRR